MACRRLQLYGANAVVGDLTVEGEEESVDEGDGATSVVDGDEPNHGNEVQGKVDRDRGTLSRSGRGTVRVVTAKDLERGAGGGPRAGAIVLPLLGRDVLYPMNEIGRCVALT